MQSDNEIIFSVSEFIELLNIGLKSFRAKIIGEVSEISFGPTGHVYFSLKDEKDGSVIECVIWKTRYDLYGIQLKKGDQAFALGCPSMHPKYGFSFIAETIEYAGEGILEKEYKKLKQKLTEEGIFEEKRKRAIPKYLQKVGVITSLKSGVVIADFSNNLGKHGFKVKMIDSRVEGQTAVEDLLSSIRTFKKQDIEALVIMRGGGSLESMLAFNNELLVREVVSFKVPVIAAVGHHKDEPLMALAADLAVSTPSIAATVLTEPWSQADLLIATALRVSFPKFNNLLQNGKINLKDSQKKLIFGFRSLLSRINRQLEHSAKIVCLNDPERQLKLGYSIARCNGKIVRSAESVKLGEDLNVRVADGTIISEIKNINHKKWLKEI